MYSYNRYIAGIKLNRKEYSKQILTIKRRDDRLNSKRIFQTVGTIASISLGIVSIEIFKYTSIMKEIDVAWSLFEFIVLLATLLVLGTTGFSFYKSKTGNEGINYFLYLCLAAVHIISIPGLLIMSLVIDFGAHWWIVLIGAILVIFWAERNKRKSRRRTVIVLK